MNADDAVESNGSIVISTSEYTDETGSFAQLSVKDNGCGIDQDMLPYIFEPFFTTKEVGRGTGLGLPMTQQIIEQHRGILTVESEPGAGTTFTICLPLGHRDRGPEIRSGAHDQSTGSGVADTS